MAAKLPNHRLSSSRPPNSDSLDSHESSSANTTKKRCSNLMPVMVAFVVIAEIGFLARLDITNNSTLVNYWDSFYQFTSLSWSSTSPSLPAIAAATTDGEVRLDVFDGGDRNSDDAQGCEKWLERQDYVEYSRDFHKQPIYVTGGDQEFKSCAVGCKFGFDSAKKADAAFGLPEHTGTASILRSMESAEYYSENNIDMARRRGYEVIMTTSLSSDVPVGYFSWAEYDIMAPLQPKTETAQAAAFISNCAARNFRLQALEALEKSNIKIDSYGGCHRNRDGRVEKVDTLKRYKFSLAFENSNEEDYVTEKFFQSLVAGSVPVVIGAPNIQEFAPSPGSVLHIKELKDADSVARTMKYLAKNPDAYNQTLKYGSGSLFMPSVHTSGNKDP
ncbi:hypothetical protein LguiA_027400 [Lonicera macranthoides]